eukprot:374607-Rhodomonas_salina.2
MVKVSPHREALRGAVIRIPIGIGLRGGAVRHRRLTHRRGGAGADVPASQPCVRAIVKGRGNTEVRQRVGSGRVHDGDLELDQGISIHVRDHIAHDRNLNDAPGVGPSGEACARRHVLGQRRRIGASKCQDAACSVRARKS